MAKRVYVAGRDKDRADFLMRYLEDRGFRITYDWTKIETKDRARKLATSMKVGVEVADALVLDGVQHRMLGALIETGIAIGFGKPVVVYDTGGDRDSVFWELDQVSVATTLVGIVEALKR